MVTASCGCAGLNNNLKEKDCAYHQDCTAIEIPLLKCCTKDWKSIEECKVRGECWIMKTKLSLLLIGMSLFLGSCCGLCRLDF